MAVSRVTLTNFRSYSDASFELGQGLNLVVGPNGSGKTNLLEAIYVVATTKSFRAADRDLVRHDQHHFHLGLAADGTDYALGFSNDSGHPEKKMTHNTVKQTLVGHIGHLPLVLFEPADLEMATGAPEVRRRYLDYILCQTDRSYLKLISRYRRILKQRNSLLAAFDTGRIHDEIFDWDIKLTEAAAEIYHRRLTVLSYLGKLVSESYKQIAGGDVVITLEYLPSVPAGNYADNFMNTLAAKLTSDLAAGFTTIGPHREDFKINFEGGKINLVASRGEVRTLVLALKLAELEYTEELTGQKPMLLLDDVFSELDHDRRRDLVKRLEGYQTVITSTDADSVTGEIGVDYKLINLGSKNA